MIKRYHPYDPATMYLHPEGGYVDYRDHLKELYKQSMEKWNAVVATDVFHDMKHGEYRYILNLLQDGEISVGKAVESIVEKAAGLEPNLPEYSTLADDRSWKERYEDLVKKIEENINPVVLGANDGIQRP